METPINIDALQLFDKDGKQIELSFDDIKQLVNTLFATHQIVEREQLQKMVLSRNSLIETNADLETIVTKTVEVIIMFNNLIGNKLPSGIMDILPLVNSITKTLKTNPNILTDLQTRIETIVELAPKYLPAETVDLLSKPYTQIKITN